MQFSSFFNVTHDECADLCFGPVGPRVGAGPLAPLREGHVPRLLLQEGAVEETEVAELGQRGGLCTPTVFTYQQYKLPGRIPCIVFST